MGGLALGVGYFRLYNCTFLPLTHCIGPPPHEVYSCSLLGPSPEWFHTQKRVQFISWLENNVECSLAGGEQFVDIISQSNERKSTKRIIVLVIIISRFSRLLWANTTIESSRFITGKGEGESQNEKRSLQLCCRDTSPLKPVELHCCDMAPERVTILPKPSEKMAVLGRAHLHFPHWSARCSENCQLPRSHLPLPKPQVPKL